jgi:hypothetical protein
MSHPLLNCSLHYSQIVVDPDLAGGYTTENRKKTVVYRTLCSNIYPQIENRKKTVVYRTLCSNIYPQIGAGSNFNQLINS